MTAPESAIVPEQAGPWPEVHIGGGLEAAEREWLHTNGAGAYAMSTLALMHTRREHGLLVAPLAPPLERTVILSHAETTIFVGSRTYRLSTHQFPEMAPTPGYRLLADFAQDPLPRWRFRLGKSWFERSLCLARGANALVLRYTWRGKAPARLSVMPLMPLRPAGELTREHGGMVQRVTLRPGEVEMKPAPRLPAVHFAHSGIFVGSPDWWRRFEYSADRARYPDCTEDMWSPGTFEIDLQPGSPTYLVVALGGLPAASPEDLMQEAVDHFLALDPGPTRSPAVRRLTVAADAFSAELAEAPAVVAGYPWSGVAVRDWLAALSGVYLARGRVHEAKRSLATLLPFVQQGGLVPARLPSSAEARPTGSPSATLWLFEAARHLMQRLEPDDPFPDSKAVSGAAACIRAPAQTSCPGSLVDIRRIAGGGGR